MSLHFAQSPTHSFLNALVATADVDDVEVGDTVEVECNDGERTIEGATVVEHVDRTTRYEWIDQNGVRQEATTGARDYVTTTHSRSLAAAYDKALYDSVPDGVAWSDDLVPSALANRLVASFDAIIASGAATYHPRSNDVVLDLVHPSLFPFVEGTSDLVRRPPARERPEFDRWGRPWETSRYRWLPSEVETDATGKARITSYVNNLQRRETHAELEELLTLALPLFESVCGYALTRTFFTPGWESKDACEADLPEPEAQVAPESASPPMSLRERRLQVVPKLVEYSLDDGEEYAGVWHVEGMSEERIVATAVYVLSRSETYEGGDIHFKRPYTPEEAGQLFWNVPQCRKRHTEEIVAEGLVPIGSLATPQGRLFVFPNCHVHKIAAMRGKGGPATRRVVVFFLVDPEARILSTADVPPQQGKMPIEEAKRIQLALMEERRLHKATMNVRAVELCEH
jgi:hypothetical protein